MLPTKCLSAVIFATVVVSVGCSVKAGSKTSADPTKFTPVVAKLRQTDETLNNGRVVKSIRREALYYRTSDGSYIYHWTSSTKDGETQPIYTGALWDNKTGNYYRLDYQNSQATMEQQGNAPVHPNAPDPNDAGLPQDSVAGVPCKVYPAKMHLSTGADGTVGSVCTSPEHNLMLRQELTYPTTNGQTVHTLMEMYDVQLGNEPDAALFDVSKQFKTVFQPATR